LDLRRYEQGGWRRRSPQLKVFATPELAEERFKENDPEGVVFGYEVIENEPANFVRL
jgi:hypothetical protein